MCFCEIDGRVLEGMKFGNSCAGAVLGCCSGSCLRCSSGSAVRVAGVQSLARVSLSGVYAGVMFPGCLRKVHFKTDPDRSAKLFPRKSEIRSEALHSSPCHRSGGGKQDLLGAFQGQNA